MIPCRNSITRSYYKLWLNIESIAVLLRHKTLCIANYYYTTVYVLWWSLAMLFRCLPANTHFWFNHVSFDPNFYVNLRRQHNLFRDSPTTLHIIECECVWVDFFFLFFSVYLSVVGKFMSDTSDMHLCRICVAKKPIKRCRCVRVSAVLCVIQNTYILYVTQIVHLWYRIFGCPSRMSRYM